MSDEILAGRTATPSSSPATVISISMVSSRSLPVRRSRSPMQLGADAREDGKGSATVGHGSAGRGKGLDEGVTLATELHG